MNTTESMSQIARRIGDRMMADGELNAWSLAEDAGAGQSFDRDDAAYAFIASVVRCATDSVVDYLNIDGQDMDSIDEDMQDIAHEHIDGMETLIYTHLMWETFVSLEGWSHDSQDDNPDETDMTRRATWTVYEIGTRVFMSVVDKITDAMRAEIGDDED